MFSLSEVEIWGAYNTITQCWLCEQVPGTKRLRRITDSSALGMREQLERMQVHEDVSDFNVWRIA